MRARCAVAWICAAALIGEAADGAPAAEIAADPPIDLAVTVYRAPFRSGGSIDLDSLEGFGLVSETRVVHLPAGESRLRFDGVAGGIEAQSAIIAGLPDRVIEKNRDDLVLSPSALLDATVDKVVELVRSNRKTGKIERVAGTVLSDAGGGVVFKTADGIEALRCSGLPETFSFAAGDDPGARPSLSVLIRSAQPLTRKVTLSYLSRGFDWAATYSATLSADARSMDLGAWVTLANSNATGFPAAHIQVVAGRVNRESDGVEPIDFGGPILANCWPRGSTSDSPPSQLRQVRADARAMTATAAMAPTALMDVAATARHKVAEEQLGDLKLYRVPERTTVASRQSKQVRLLDRAAIPVTTYYRAVISPEDPNAAFAAQHMLRAKNDQASHLGLPLPSGSVAVFTPRDGRRLLLHESELRDLAVNETIEIDLGSSADVQVAVAHERVAMGSAQAKLLPLVPGVTLRSVTRAQRERVEVSNARAAPIEMELRVVLYGGAQVIRADHPLDTANGQSTFKLTIPAASSVALRYQIQFQTDAVTR